MDLHKCFQELFLENIGFFGGFQNDTKRCLSKTAYELTNISHVDVSSKYLYSQVTSEPKENVLSDGLQFVYL